jgi:hypothetical protein
MKKEINTINKLLQDVTVEWKTLGEVVKLEQPGKQLNKELLSDNYSIPLYNGGTTYSGYTDDL